MDFVDVNSFCPGWVFAATNEDFGNWSELIDQIEIEDAAGICSGGEVGLFLILPKVKNKLVLVDHCYGSMYYALSKYLLLQENQPEEIYRLIADFGSNERRVRVTINSIENLLPQKILQNRITTDFYNVSKVWRSIPVKNFVEAKPKLDLVKFIHGDLSDLEPEGPFDFLYLSNALEHTSREYKQPEIDRIELLLKPGGFVLCSEHQYHYGSPSPNNWELIESKKDPNTAFRWNQNLYRVERPV